MKDSKEYKAMPYSVCSQKVIEHLCNDWKAFYESMKEYKKNPKKFKAKPEPPNYYDKDYGREWITITYQQLEIKEGYVEVKAKFLEGLRIKSSKKNIKQVSIKTNSKGIQILLQYSVSESEKKKDNGRYMGIDLGVNNLATCVSNTEVTPFIMNGRVVKSINQYYNKEVSRLQGIAKKCNGLDTTKKIRSITHKRNNKVSDYMHKVSKEIVERALQNNICEIVIGLNVGWKQGVDIGKSTQTFVEIPYSRLIENIKYKSKLVGIRVRVVEESYTSGTSYVDNEPVEAVYCNKRRRVHRGLFRGTNGIEINADVNGGYQILKASGRLVAYKGYEKVERVEVA